MTPLDDSGFMSRHTHLYRVRSGQVMLPKDVSWVAATGE